MHREGAADFHPGDVSAGTGFFALFHPVAEAGQEKLGDITVAKTGSRPLAKAGW